MAQTSHRPIGIFDSGSGGLTILKAITQVCPTDRFVYLGDHAHGPFGDKDADQVYELTRQGVQLLFEKGCALVILACNTASAVALRRLQEQWLTVEHPDKRVLGVLIPLIEEITQTLWVRHTAPTSAPAWLPIETVGVFATPSTIQSDAYRREITVRAPHIRIVQQACPGLADTIEQDAPAIVLREMIHHFVQSLIEMAGTEPPSSVILGCTHYPLVADHFRDALPAQTRVIEQNTIVARSFADYLDRHKKFASTEAKGSVELLTTGDPIRANKLAQRFLSDAAAFSRIGRHQ